MSDYRRVYHANATYFFTLATHKRRPLFTDAENVNRLRQAFAFVRRKRPFALEAIVVLPDHLHCLWGMPADPDFSARWQVIKTHVTRGIGLRGSSGDKRVWQPRFWEHLIRDRDDYDRHLDYIHFNPVRHGYVAAPGDWPYSSFTRFVERGWYAPDWGRSEPEVIRGMDLE